MTFARQLFLTTATLLAVTSGVAEAAQLRSAPSASTPGAGAGSFAGGAPVGENCWESHPDNPKLCDIDDFVARCDEAGGGVSKKPGGGLECSLNW